MALRHDGKKQISLWIQAEDVKRLKHWAVRRGTTASYILARVIEDQDEVDYLLFAKLDQSRCE